MNNEYRIAKGWRIFLHAVLPLFAAGFIYMGLSPFLEPPSNKSMYVVLPLLAVVLCALIAWGYVDLYGAKLVLEDDRVVQVSAFRTKELPAALVKGFSEEQNYVVLHPAEEGFPTIKISTYTGRLAELKEALAERFRNLDQEQYEAEELELLQQEELGATEEERSGQLQGIRKLTRTVNGLALGCCLWLFFYPQPYELAMYTAMAFLPVVLLIVYRYKGLIRLDENAKGAYPNLSSALMLPAIALMLRALLDYSIFEYRPLWQWVGICSLVLYGVAVAATRVYKDQKQWAKSLLLLLFLGCFSFGALVQVNCLNDPSVTKVYRANVLDKRISSGKHTSYYLKLAPWGPQREADEVSVSRDLYNRVGTGQLMQVYLKKGKLDIPWFIVTD